MHPHFQTKKQICLGAQKYSNAKFFLENYSSFGGWKSYGRPNFSAWDSINTLTGKCLVMETGFETYGLTEEGLKKAGTLKEFTG